MTHFLLRRALLLGATAIPFARMAAAGATATPKAAPAETKLADLERASGGRLGLSASNTASGVQLGYRAYERFPFCSTFKFILVGAILARSTRVAGLMRRRVKYARSDLAHYSPIAEKHVAAGMTVGELCRAAIQYSDNTAANLLLKILGGPPAVTAFARSIGDAKFRLDRWEPALNTALPGDLRDTSTPAAMAGSLRSLALGDALPPGQRQQLQDWLCGNTTGGARIRAGVSAGWRIGDKTGTGDYGTTNDIAVLWPPARPPVVLAVYFTQRTVDAKPRDDIVAAAARIVAGAFG